jgi:hypothetical protein
MRIADCIMAKAKGEYARNPVLFTALMLALAFVIVFFICVLATGGQALYGMICEDHSNYYYDYFYSVASSFNHPYTLAHVIYPPLATVMYTVIGIFTIPFVENPGMPDLIYALRGSQMGIMSYYLIVTLLTFAFFVIVKHSSELRRYAMAFCFLFLMSYPFIYAVDRGNIVLLILPLCLIFLLGYRSENKTVRYISYVALAIAVSVKIYPIFLGLLLIRERNWRETGLCVALGLIFFFVPFLFTDGNIAILIENIQIHIGSYTSGPTGFTLMHQVLNVVVGSSLPAATVLALGYILTAVLFIPMILIIVYDKKAKDWEVIALAMCMAFFGPAVAVMQYMLVLLALPFIFFLRSEKELSKQNLLFVIIFIVGLAPLPGLLDLGGMLISQNVVIGIKSAFMALMMICLIVTCALHFRKSARKDGPMEELP